MAAPRVNVPDPRVPSDITRWSGPSIIVPSREVPTPRPQADSKIIRPGHAVPNDWGAGGFSAVDLTVYFAPNAVTGKEPVKFGTLSMISVSSHRDKFPVSSLSRVAPRGFTAGHRTIAGTLAFNTIQRDAFEAVSHSSRGPWYFPAQADELPPFDIHIVMCNDFGDVSVAILKGVTLLDSGTTYSLDQVVLNEVYSYMCLDRTPLRPWSSRTPWTNMTEPAQIEDVTSNVAQTPGTHIYEDGGRSGAYGRSG